MPASHPGDRRPDHLLIVSLASVLGAGPGEALARRADLLERLGPSVASPLLAGEGLFRDGAGAGQQPGGERHVPGPGGAVASGEHARQLCGEPLPAAEHRRVRLVVGQQPAVRAAAVPARARGGGSGRLRLPPAGPDPLYAVAFSPDGGTLATAGRDGTARSWDVAFPAGLLAAACAIADQSLTRQQWAGYAGTQPFQRVCPAS